MYKILVKNQETGVMFWNYGFTNWMAKRIYFLMNEQNSYTYERIYKVIFFFKIDFTWKNFKKCLTNESHVV